MIKRIFRSKVFLKYGLLLSLALLPLYPSTLKAQVLTCTGSACPAEITVDLTPLGDVLRRSYGAKLSDSFSSAHGVSNVALSPNITDLNLGIVSFGINLSFGRERGDIGLEDTAAGSSIENPDFGGIHLQGLSYLGFNLGALFGLWGWSDAILSATDLYYGKTDTEIHSSFGTSIDSLEYNFNTSYFGFRYQLIESLGVFLAGWQGLSLHIGRINSKMSLELEDKDGSPSKRFTIAGFNWQADNEIAFRSRTKTTLVELNTSLKFLFLAFSIGGGFSYHSTNSRIHFKRSGNLYDGDAQRDAVLSAEFDNPYDKDSYRIRYMRMGLDFIFIPFTRIGLEAVYSSGDLYAVNLGTRINI